MGKIEEFYDAHSQYEWDRLNRHRMEFALNMRLLKEHLPPPPCHILDVGGGPGRYAVALARQGYRVTLFDLSAQGLEFARNKATEAGVTLAATVHGNALDLSRFGDADFDVVLEMGPLYHLLKAAERECALQEARRVVKPGGLLAAAFINRYATIRVHQADWTLRNLPAVQAELETGIRRDEDGHFTDSFAIHPREVRPLLKQCGFVLLQMIASEGLRSDIDGLVDQLSAAEWDAWTELNYRIGKDPAVQGAGVHLLAVARRQ